MIRRHTHISLEEPTAGNVSPTEQPYSILRFMPACGCCQKPLPAAIHVYQYTDSGKERVPQHPLYFLLHDQPNPEMTSFVFRETLMSHLLIYGNAYAQIIRNGRGDVLGLYPLMPDKMKVDRDEKPPDIHLQPLR